MIRDVAQLDDGAVLRGEVGVVGAGFAGLELADHLERHGVRVVLLESGGLDFDPRTQELAHVQSVGKPIWEPDPDHELTPYLAPEVRGEARIRQFGGTSNTWTGKWRIFDELDFEVRPWVPHSGWPITLEELLPFYSAAVRDYGLAEFEAFERNEKVRRLRGIASRGGLEVSCHVWQGKTLRLRDRFASRLSQSDLVDVVLGANATEIVLDEDLDRVRSISFRSLQGGRYELEAENFVLATGGLEGPRLLLASNRQLSAGIGNEHGLVGRFHANHPKHKTGVLWPSRELAKPVQIGTADHLRPSYHATFQLSPDEQRRRGVLNHALRLIPRYRHDVEYPAGRAQALRDALRAKSPHVAAQAAFALATRPRALGKVASKALHHGHGGRLHHYALTMYFEQAPNPDSRVYLAAKRDALGMPKLVVDWRLNALDRESFKRTLHGLSEGFERAGLGRLDFGPVTFDDTFDAAHHIGATRMATSPMEGVVDPHCRVFSTENLFIASSSVFSTGGSMAPTLTIVALARRLAIHLLDSRAGRGRAAASVAP
jgi:choline dehydrogenase-like flavoprotein